MANKKILATIIATVAASLCCVTPVLAILAGSSSLATSFSWMEPYHEYLVGLTILVLLYAWWDKLKPKSDDIACACDEKTGFFSSKLFLAIVTIFAIVMLTFPKWGYSYFDIKSDCNACTTEISTAAPVKPVKTDKASPACATNENCDSPTKPKMSDEAPAVKKTANTEALPVFKYMSEEKANPTPYNEKACAGSGRQEIDTLMRNARAEVEEMSPVVLKKMIDNEEEFVLLDVRESEQRAEGTIYADEIISLTRGDLEFEIMNKIKNKDAVIITYCRSGGRGLFTAQTLKHLGYANAYNLKGGLKAWARAGFPFDNGLGVVAKVTDE